MLLVLNVVCLLVGGFVAILILLFIFAFFLVTCIYSLLMSLVCNFVSYLAFSVIMPSLFFACDSFCSSSVFFDSNGVAIESNILVS